MELKGILSISGEPGLYKMIKHSKNSIIVESIVNGKRMPAYASSKISALEDIAIYTDEGDVPLGDVLKKVYEKEEGKATPISHKASAEELKAYFLEILPTYDRDRVYVSDIKRLINWYNTLQANNMLILKTEESENDEADKKDENTTEQE